MQVTKKSSDALKTVMGPLWNLYSKESVWEIMIDSFNEVYYSATGGIKSEKIFKSNAELEKFINSILKYAKKKITEDEFSYYIHINDGTKINIVLPPVAVKGPSVVITKNPTKSITLEDFIKWKVINVEGKALLEKILNSNKGFLVAGNMGSGKTTLLSTLVNSIPMPQRIITLERMSDLIFSRPNICRLQPKTPKSTEMIELIHIAERMRGDYVVLAECSGPEVGPFMEMIRSVCSGIALTIGETVTDAINRLVTKIVISSEGYSLEEARYSLAQAFPYIIFQEKRPDGLRVISSIKEIEYHQGELKVKAVYKN